jgi:hypothetical protein
MAAEPELYLSLLSSRYAERRDNDVGSRILQVDEPFHKVPDRLLDALAAICVHKEQGDIFFVSLAMDSIATTLYVSTNGTVPATVTNHLRIIWRKLKDLKSVLDSASSPPPNIESPDPNNTQLRSDVELDIQRIIYEYCYKKVQRRFRKRGPDILAKYDTIAESLRSNNTVIAADTKLLNITRRLLEDINDFLQDQIPQELRFTHLIKSIAVLSVNWKKHLGAVEESEVGLLTQWDNLTCKSGLVSPIYDTRAHLLFLVVKKNRHLSLRRFLQKLFTLHHHIRTILRIA